jgi:hypothetical protein
MKKMKDELLRLKITTIISNLNEIIIRENEQTQGFSEIQKCRQDLEKILRDLNNSRQMNSIKRLIPKIYRLAEVLYFWIMK